MAIDARSELCKAADQEKFISFGSIVAIHARCAAVLKHLRNTWQDPDKAQAEIVARAICEPQTGKCGAIIYTSIATAHLSDELRTCLESRIVISQSSIATPGRTSPCIDLDSSSLHIPVVLVEYQKHSDTNRDNARNQGRMYLESTVTMLAESLDVMDFPIFSLVVSGLTGSLLMAWHSKDTKACSVSFIMFFSNHIPDRFLADNLYHGTQHLLIRFSTSP